MAFESTSSEGKVLYVELSIPDCRSWVTKIFYEIWWRIVDIRDVPDTVMCTCRI